MPQLAWRLALAAATAATLAVRVPGAQAGDGIAGIWEGQYDCNQGLTGLSLFVAQPSQGRLKTVFFFYPTAENPGVPEGCFEMSGRYDGATGDVQLVAGRWLLRPEGYVTVNLSAALDTDTAEIAGIVNGPGCTEFLLRRTTAATRPFPPACRPPALVGSLGR